ncbi:hypothetical protein [Streptomyces sp. NPDC091371]|uniref:hypothetical protein n=1 Tax=Streptomyces sp. NPDC091371 TaxID=3155303 RepID=UPI00343E84F1
MFWKRLGDSAATEEPVSAVERPAPVERRPPEPWDPALPCARLPVHNRGQKPLELFIEPYCFSEWLEPDQQVTVITLGSTDDPDRPWSGTLAPDEPFHVDYHPDLLVVWPNGGTFLIVDADGNEMARF